MKRQEVLKMYKLKSLPSKVDEYPEGVECIAKVEREFGKDDFAIYKNGRCVKDKGFRYRIRKVLQFYYDAPVVEKTAESKLEELQKMAAEAQRQKDIEEIWDEAHLELERRSFVRPTERKAMQDLIKEKGWYDGNPYILKNEVLNSILDEKL